MAYSFPDQNVPDDIAPYREQEVDPDNFVFEIGLVMAGAISAGSYTAGVLDYLFEALDAWEKAKSDPNVPQHKVRIRVIAGASAGGMNAAIAAGALRYDFPHLRPGTDPRTLNNPFYTAWVKDISIDKLLEDNDLRQSGIVTSLLDCTVLQQITDRALNYTAPEVTRPWLSERVRYIFTQTSLRGIPYYVPMLGNNGNGMTMTLHKTWRSFSVEYPGQNTFKRRPDDVRLNASVPHKTSHAEWAELGNAALGSGAFPLALAPRAEDRMLTDLTYRFVVTSEPGSDTPCVRQLQPTWPGKPAPPTSWKEYIVDGGMMDNEPLELARVEMAGLNNHNPREGCKARRAVVMVDPFPQTNNIDSPEPERPFTLLNSLKGLFPTVLEQLRFNVEDLTLAIDEKVYSRFLIAPVRSQDNQVLDVNDRAIACGSLGGFGGFLSEEYRHHDFMLGRRNCQQFLRAYFSLPQDNPLFKAGGHNIPIVGNDEFPIIPLVGSPPTEPLPVWPQRYINLQELTDKIDERAEKVVKTFANAPKPPPKPDESPKKRDYFLVLLKYLLYTRWIRMKAITPLMDYIKKDLRCRNLPFKES